MDPTNKTYQHGDIFMSSEKIFPSPMLIWSSERFSHNKLKTNTI